MTNFSHIKVSLKTIENRKVCERQIKRKEHGGEKKRAMKLNILALIYLI